MHLNTPLSVFRAVTVDYIRYQHTISLKSYEMILKASAKYSNISKLT